MSTLSRTLERVSAARGKAKIEELAYFLSIEGSGDLLCRILHMAYDPFVRFGIAKTGPLLKSYTDLNMDNTGELTPAVLDALVDLSNRTVTGNAAKSHLLSAMNDAKLCEEDAEVVMNILKKDLRIGMAETSINAALENVGMQQVRTYDCMLAHPFDAKRFVEGKQYVFQLKLDGMRAQAHVDVSGGTVVFRSRNGLEIESVSDEMKAELLDAARSHHSMYNSPSMLVIEGELVVDDAHFNETISSAKKKKEQQDNLVFRFFDVLSVEEFEGTAEQPSATYAQRLARINAFPSTTRVVRLDGEFVTTVAECMAKFAEALARGQEGGIVKDLDAPYEPKRSYAWMKLKADNSEDLPVTGTKPGTGKYEGMIGAYICTRPNGVEVDVGSGISDEERKKDPSEVIGRIAEVGFHEETPDGSLRHPKFLRWRDDKKGKV